MSCEHFQYIVFFHSPSQFCDSQRKRKCFSSYFYLKICLNQSWTKCSVDDCVGAECKRRSRCSITFSYRFIMQKKHMHESAVYIASELKAKKRAGRMEKKRVVHIQARLLGAAALFIPLPLSLYLHMHLMLLLF